MKTALQEFMEWIEINDNSYNALFAYQKAEELLEKEKEQIVKAWEDGWNNAVMDEGDEIFSEAEDYLNQTYKQ